MYVYYNDGFTRGGARGGEDQTHTHTRSPAGSDGVLLMSRAAQMLCAPLSLNESKAGPDAADNEQPFPASGSLCGRQRTVSAPSQLAGVRRPVPAPSPLAATPHRLQGTASNTRRVHDEGTKFRARVAADADWCKLLPAFRMYRDSVL